MLGLFGKRSPRECPVPEDSRKWLDLSFPFLLQRFGEEEVKQKKILIPHHSDFPIRYDGSETAAWDTLSILTKQMELSWADISLDIVDGERKSLSYGEGTIYLGNYDKVTPVEKSFPYKAEDGKYYLEVKKKMLTDPEGLVAWLALHLARLRLIEHPQPEENKLLADLATVLLGVGIFNANAAYREIQTVDSRGHQRIGFLKQREWGYALALFARLRGEKDPDWVKYLTKNIRSDFSKSQAWLDSRD